MKAKMKVLVDKIEEYRGVEEGMHRTLLTAQSIAQETIDKAKKEAEEIIASAKDETANKVKDTQAEINTEEQKLETARKNTAEFIAHVAKLYQSQARALAELAKGENLAPVQQTEEHIRNHQAYVQSWIRQIREKPESLVRAIQSAEQVSNYLEYHEKRITWEEYQKRVGEVQSNTPSEEKLPEKHPQREEKERMDSILKDVPDFGTNQKRRIVAVESTKDYEDPDFTPNRYNSKGSGREDYYRVVGIQEGGWYVEPVEDKIYHSYREAEKAIKATPAWKQISYDRLIQESGKERTRKLEAREKIRTEVDNLEEKISQLKEKQGYLKQLLKECEENPKLAQARQQILEYEKSIGRMESCMKEAGEAELLAYAKQCEEYLAFGESVDQLTDVLKTKEQMSMREAVSVCKTPDLLQKAGCKPLPMHMSQQHLLDCMHPKQKENAHYHGLTKQKSKKSRKHWNVQ